MGWVRVVVWFGRIVRVRVRVWVRVWMRNKGIGAANVVSRDCALASDLVRAIRTRRLLNLPLKHHISALITIKRYVSRVTARTVQSLRV